MVAVASVAPHCGVVSTDGGALCGVGGGCVVVALRVASDGVSGGAFDDLPVEVVGRVVGADPGVSNGILTTLFGFASRGRKACATRRAG